MDFAIWQKSQFQHLASFTFGKLPETMMQSLKICNRTVTFGTRFEMDNCICSYHAYGANCTSTGFEYLSCDQEMVNTEEPYAVACNCSRFFQYVPHILACHINVLPGWRGMWSLYYCYACPQVRSSGTYLHSVIVNRPAANSVVNGGKFSTN